MIKRLLTFLLAGTLLLSAAGCGQTPTESRTASDFSSEGAVNSSRGNSSEESSNEENSNEGSSSEGSTGSGGSSGENSSGVDSSGESSSGGNSSGGGSNGGGSGGLVLEGGFRAVTYPAGAVQTLEQRGLSADKFAGRAAAGHDYTGNGGHSGSGLVISPYYALRVNGREVPVYAAQVYIGSSGGKGALHSFAVVETQGDIRLTAALRKLDGAPADAVVLPASRGVKPAVSGDTVTLTVDEPGSYTVLVDCASQESAFTLFVRAARDKEKEIEEYRDVYGKDHVLVYEPGVHEVDFIDIPSNDYVVYLRTGALLLAKHKFDIRSDEENQTVQEEGIAGKIGTAQKRFPFINCHSKKNVRIVGGGTIDFTPLDWHERRGVFMTFTRDIHIEGITLVNAPEWTLTTYRCTNVGIKDLIIFGYRTNSDGVAICNSVDVTVSDCFARSGDDLFEVKTLGGDASAVSRNVAFSNCVAWGGKARCFGIIGEVNRPISNVAFRDCAILYRDATWDNDRLGGLVIVVEETGAAISDVVFENIEIFRDMGRAINCIIYNPQIKDCPITGVKFRNITYTAELPSQFKMREQGCSLAAVLAGVRAGGETITQKNLGRLTVCDAACRLTITE